MVRWWWGGGGSLPSVNIVTEAVNIICAVLPSKVCVYIYCKTNLAGWSPSSPHPQVPGGRNGRLFPIKSPLTVQRVNTVSINNTPKLQLLLSYGTLSWHVLLIVRATSVIFYYGAKLYHLSLFVFLLLMLFVVSFLNKLDQRDFSWKRDFQSVWPVI